MNIKVLKIELISGKGKTKAMVDVSFDDRMTIFGFKVYRGWAGGEFVEAPMFMDKRGAHFPRIIITDELLLNNLKSVVLKHYQDAVRASNQSICFPERRTT
jgi:DNA-binding cell septation regulator SpoVG